MDNKCYQLLVKESLLISNIKPTFNKTACSVLLLKYPEGLHRKKNKVKIKSTKDTLPKANGLCHERS